MPTKAKAKATKPKAKPSRSGAVSRTTAAKRMAGLGYEHVAGWLPAEAAGAVKRQIAAAAAALKSAPARRKASTAPAPATRAAKLGVGRTMAERIARSG